MHDLPARPDLGQLRHQARDLLRAARAGDPAAAERMRAVSDRMTLAAAQLAVAREYGFASWPRLKAEVEERNTNLAQKVDAFLEASVRDWTGRAGRMLAGTPEIAGYDFRTAVILGDAARVREILERDPELATRPDPRWGWTPLHAVCGSRWHRLDPGRGDGLLAVARLLLAAGADPSARSAGQHDGWPPLRCAVAGVANPALTGLLLEHGAAPDDHDLYLACFGDDDHESLRLLLSHVPNVSETTALAAPISTGDTEGVRLLLQAGADPNRLPPADLYGAGHAGDPPWPAVYAAVRSGCPAELVELLLDHGADPDAAGPDGRSPYALATSQGKTDLIALLRRHGARGDASDIDRFLSACLRTDQAEARRQLAAHPGLPGQLADTVPDAVVRAAEAGHTPAVQLLLDLGFDIEARGDNGATALHAAAYSGCAGTVRFLLGRGADIEARDTTWNGPPLDWAIVGSGERPTSNPSPDWIATVRTLIEAGASTQGITLSPDDPKPPSPEVAQLLRGYGIGGG
jgi:ankyrin repeat protein